MDHSLPTSATSTPVGSATPPTSYVDRYQPPVTTINPSPSPMTTDPTNPAPAAPAMLDVDHTAALPTASTSTPAPVSTASVAPTSSAAPNSSATPVASGEQSQTLEDQNIFHLLGVEDAKDEEKEAFLDELQQIIWEDFLENDVELLLTEDELKEFKALSDKTYPEEEERQNALVEFLEKYVPDLEKIMLEKALELKEEMTRERVKEMLEVHANTPDKLAKVKMAQDSIDRNQWRDAANTLNSLAA